jgi:hypothetical protein
MQGKYSLPSGRIFNAEETGVSVVHENVLRVLLGKRKFTCGERGRNFTLLLCASASGDQFFPPIFVFLRKRMDNKLEKDAPESSSFDAQENGRVTSTDFLTWMEEFVSRVHLICRMEIAKKVFECTEIYNPKSQGIRRLELREFRDISNSLCQLYPQFDYIRSRRTFHCDDFFSLS